MFVFIQCNKKAKKYEYNKKKCVLTSKLKKLALLYNKVI